MDELYESINDIRMKLVSIDERQKEQEKKLNNYGDIVLTLRDVVNEQKNTSNELKRLRNDIDEIKGKPAKRWDLLIAAIITGVIGFLISKFFV